MVNFIKLWQGPIASFPVLMPILCRLVSAFGSTSTSVKSVGLIVHLILMLFQNGMAFLKIRFGSHCEFAGFHCCYAADTACELNSSFYCFIHCTV